MATNYSTSTMDDDEEEFAYSEGELDDEEEDDVDWEDVQTSQPASDPPTSAGGPTLQRPTRPPQPATLRLRRPSRRQLCSKLTGTK